MADFIVANAEKCIGCRTCEVACAQAHLPDDEGGAGEIVQRGNFFPRLRVLKLDHISVPVTCHQCERAPCVASCPVSALTQDETSVKADAALCIACKNCVIACPFGTISIESGPPEIIKCDLCAHQPDGPACIAACPTDAISKISTADLSRLTQQRLAKSAAAGFFPEL